MDISIQPVRQELILKVLDKQDAAFRWGFDAQQARQRPEYLYYAPNFKSTLWTLVLLADLQAQPALPQAWPALQLVGERFYDAEHGIFGFPNRSYFPIPCLNGNMIYLHQYFESGPAQALERTIDFFAAHQRFDDGGFKTPPGYPYCGNTSCYGRHTCYWGVTKLLKGVSFIPREQRSPQAQRLLENGIQFVLQHEVCYRSHRREEFLHRDITRLTFPNFYKSDFLEILWLLAREGVRHPALERPLALLRSKMKDGGGWELEKAQNTIVPAGQVGRVNAFVTERARQVLEGYGYTG
jgi:hypothetical protein